MSKGKIRAAFLLAMRLFRALKNWALPKSGGKGNAEEQQSHAGPCHERTKVLETRQGLC